ncbi:MAG: DUF1573 domain-containing protein [Verrucomicrobiae bacterium]|nr:DUF1573 domain-containing protein [Verrucomicrobiae bacterium]
MFLSPNRKAKSKLFKRGRELAPVGFIFVFHAMVTVTYGQLKWDCREMDFSPTPLESRIIAHFTFTNSGKKPVAIAAVKSSCGCTSLMGDKKVYQPGERGEITAVFEFGQRVGAQEKTIVVQSDDPVEPTALLKFKVTIPEIIRMAPLFVNWFKGEPAEAKTVTLKVVHSEPVKVVRAKSNNEKMSVRLKTIKEGKEYLLAITPADTTQPVAVAIDIQTDFPRENPKIFKVFALVRGR